MYPIITLKDIHVLLEKGNFSSDLSRIVPLIGGANNRVYKITLSSNENLLLKHYFQHPDDKRKRLQTEYRFLEYANKKKICSVPKPFSFNSYKNLALYSFIQGAPFQNEDLQESHINEALDFFLELNINKNEGNYLPKASESCFRTSDYFSILEHRLEKLLKAEEASVQNFVKNDLVTTYEKIKQKTLKEISSLEKPLSVENLCLSPSDFGFHNALLYNGKCFFIDFEYAGWDDPVKALCDFLLQPKIPVPQMFAKKIAKKIASVTSDREDFFKRAELLFPLLQLKWCCIILGPLMDIGKTRRKFSQVKDVDHLAKARDCLSNIEKPESLFPIFH